MTQQGGEDYVRLKAIEKWHGILPVNLYGSAPLPFVQVQEVSRYNRPQQRRRNAVRSNTRATIDDLYKAEGKAELVHGEIVQMPPAGDEPSVTGGAIFANLREYARRTRRGRAYPDGAGFRVNLPHRESFSPDAAYYIGQRMGLEFLEGAPVFAVEVRSKSDYGPAAERAMAEKRADYFACGTLVVWDVDLLSEDVVKSYKASDPEHPVIFRRGGIADAEPAVPGWRMNVHDLFE